MVEARQTDSYVVGLAVAKQILKAHGSVIGVESKLGKWSKFIFRLPHV